MYEIIGILNFSDEKITLNEIKDIINMIRSAKYIILINKYDLLGRPIEVLICKEAPMVKKL